MIDIESYHLKSLSFFEILDTEEKKLVKDKMVRLEFRKRQLLFKEGSHSKGVYIVRKGKIKIYKTNAQGNQSIIYIYKKGDFFGYRPLLAQDPQPVSAVAMDNVVVSYIPREFFISLYNSSDTLARRLVSMLAKEFTVWINKMTVFAEYSVRERVALSLLILNRVYQKKDEKRVTISIGRDDFASFVGTAKESLVRTLRHFKDEKIITTQNTKIVVLKPELLHQYF